MGTQSVQMKGVLSWLVRWACRTGTRDFCSALAALYPVQNVFSLTVHYFNAFVLVTQQAGQAAVLGRLSLSVCVSGNEFKAPKATKGIITVKGSILSSISLKFFVCFKVSVPFILCSCVLYGTVYFVECSMRSHTIFLISVLAEFIRPTLC